jgi:hypothetical protein
MNRKPYSLRKQWVMVTMFALGAPSIALADDNSMNPFIGDSYRYFNGRNVGAPPSSDPALLGFVPADPAWRRSHPNGLAESDLQGLASSALSAQAERLNAPILASAPADPAWRQNHPHGIAEGELQALASSTLAAWQRPNGSKTTASGAVGPLQVAQGGAAKPASTHPAGSSPGATEDAAR